MSNYLIYKATSPSGKCYIGITSRPLIARRAEHYYNCKRSNTRFYAALRKYKQEVQWEILQEGLTKEQAIVAEVRLISELQPKYNSSEGGEGNWGWRATEDTKRKMSESSFARYARTPKDQWAPKAAIDKNKRKVVDLDTGIVYDSGLEAARQLGIDCSRIHKYCKKQVKSQRYRLEYQDGVS